MRVPIITDEAAQVGGWHGRVLQAAFAKHGIEAVFVELQDCMIDLSQQQPKISLPTFKKNPKIAFVRGIAAGTLQQVVTRLNVLHMLSLQGTKVYNDGKAIERTVDKAMTSFLLKQHGVPTPETWVCESRQVAHNIIENQMAHHDKLVIKPLFGSQGNGVRLLDKNSTPPLPRDDFVDGVYYLQRYIDTGRGNHDFRVFVVNNKVVAAMQRNGSGWLNNIAQGAKCMPIHDDAIYNLAISAAEAVSIDYCGVDIIRDKDDQLWVLEVNSIPAWAGLQSITEIDIAETLVKDLISKSNGE